jgi:lipoprotein-anchoring transpeptidase ErfK/SrfK
MVDFSALVHHNSTNPLGITDNRAVSMIRKFQRGLTAAFAGVAFGGAAIAAQLPPPPPPQTVPTPSTPAPEAAVPSVVVPPKPAPAPAPAPAPKAVARKGPVDSLKPGQFVWEKRETYNNPLRMVAVLDIQRMYVFDGDELVGFTTISSGKKGKETPTGAFKILQKKEYHESNIYANAPMPFMQRLTWDGIALHAGKLPGYPASHGCIRLPRTFAQALYNATIMDAEVVILPNLGAPRPKPQPEPVPPPAVEPKPVEPEATPPTLPVEPLEPGNSPAS